MKADLTKFEAPERPRHRPSKTNKTCLSQEMNKADKYEQLAKQLGERISYLESQIEYYKHEKGKLNIGFSNGYIAGRIAELEDTVSYLKRILK